MSFNEKINKWSRAHVFYNMFTHEPPPDASMKVRLEYEWRIRMIQEAPNGELLIKNSLFELVQNSSKIYMAHITPNLEQIIQSGAIYSSGGCLLGGIYTTPLFKEDDRLRVHNLGRYVIQEEAPRAAYLQKKNNPDAVIIELSMLTDGYKNLIGIDYTRLGDIHFDIYRELEYLLSFSERLELYDVISRHIKNSLGFLSLANSAFVTGKTPNPESFFELYVKAIDDLPILGYLYFEALSEYLMLFEDSKEARRAHAFGEFYNYSYKNLMFDLFPDMLLGRSLGTFNPTLNQLEDYIHNKGIISNFNKGEMARYLVERLVFLINTRLFNNPETLISWRDLKWDFDSLALVASPLLGHLIHREFRNFGRYPDFYFYFDQFKALQVWNYWNNMDVIVPFNGFFPKGETGINPAWPDLEYKIYSGKKLESNLGELYLVPDVELDVKVIPRLVNIKYTTMRSKDRKSVDIAKKLS